LWIHDSDDAFCATHADAVICSDSCADSHCDTLTFGESVAERERVAESD